MALMGDIADGILDKIYVEPSLEEIHACILDTVFGSYSADIHIVDVHYVQHLIEALAGIIDAFESRILFRFLAIAFVEGKSLFYVRLEVVMDFGSSGALYAMRRPRTALLLEGTVVCRMMVAYEQGREGCCYHIISILGGRPFLFDILHGLPDGILRIGTSHGAVNEIIKHIHYNECNVFHLFFFFYFYGCTCCLELSLEVFHLFGSSIFLDYFRYFVNYVVGILEFDSEN